MDHDLGYDYNEAIKRQNISIGDLDELRKSIENIAPKTITNKQLLLFLDACGSIDEAKKVVDIYYKARLNAPEHFLKRDPECDEIQQCLDNQDYFTLPPTSSGCPIVFHRLKNSKPSNYHFDHAIKTYFMTLDACLYKYGPRPGYIFVFDMNNVRLGHLLRVRISSIKKFFHYLQEGVPGKLYEIHILNVVTFFDKVLSLIKPFMKAEIFKVLYTHPPDTNMETFYKQWISKEYLPSDFGGTMDSVDELHDNFREELMELRNYFIDEEKQRAEYKNGFRDANENIKNLSKLEID